MLTFTPLYYGYSVVGRGAVPTSKQTNKQTPPSVSVRMPLTEQGRSVRLTDPALTKANCGGLLERLLGHFLFHRGQIDKPLEQMRAGAEGKRPAPTRVELQYAERSTPYRGLQGADVLFATPLTTPGPRGGDVDRLAQSIQGFSIHTEEDERVADTPLTSRNVPPPPTLEQPVEVKPRRVLGKLQEVSVPITPQQTFKKRKSQSSTSYLLEIVEQIGRLLARGVTVNQVIILIGSTIMSPKETYIIDTSSLRPPTTPLSGRPDPTLPVSGRPDLNLPDSGRPDPNLSLSLRQIMQQLFTDPHLNSLPSLASPTNCHVVLKVERATLVATEQQQEQNHQYQQQQAFFLPKLRFSLPKRGSRYTLRLTHGDQGVTSQDMTSQDEDVTSLDQVYLAAPRPFRATRTVDSPVSRDLLDSIQCC